MNLPNIIETKRLIIYPISEKFSQDIFENFTPKITKYMFPASAKELSETNNYINDAKRKNQIGEDFQVSFTNKTGEFIGNGGLHHINTKRPEFGVWVKESAHGHGYGREAMQAMKAWADENLDYEYITYPVDKKNMASRKVAESMDGVIEDEYPKETMNGSTLDCIEYRIYPNNGMNR